MDLIPKAKKGIIYYLKKIKNNYNYTNLVSILKYSLYISPFILLCSLLILKRKNSLKLNQTFKHSGFYQILISNKSKQINFVNFDDKKNLKYFYNFQRKNISYCNPTGIHNYGSNCYMNSLIQCLSSSEEFTNLLKKIILLNELQKENFNKNQKEDNEFLKILSENINHINNYDTILYPKELVKFINKLFHFEFDQQDSYELYHRILDILDKFIAKYQNLIDKSEKSSLETMKLDNSHFKNPFAINIKHEIECISCKNRKSNQQTINDLSIDGKSVNQIRNVFVPSLKFIDIPECIKNYSLPELIHDYECMNCNIIHLIKYLNSLKNQFEFTNKSLFDQTNNLRSYLETLSKNAINAIDDINSFIISISTDKNLNLNCEDIIKFIDIKKIKTKISKRQIIKQFPDILVIHMQKIHHYDQDNGAKITKNTIYFPPILIVYENGLEIKYELLSFLQHMGSDIYGHYISFKNYSKDKWIVINDSQCIPISPDKIKETDPYMIFYRRC